VSIGPSVAVRFLPIIAAVAIAFRFRRRSSVPHLALGVLLVYLIPCVALLSTTVVGVVSAAASGSLASDTATLFKTLVTAHADGYWTATQGERFLLPVARQAENSLLAFRSTIALIFAGGLFIASGGWFIGDGWTLETARCARSGSSLFDCDVWLGVGVLRALLRVPRTHLLRVNPRNVRSSRMGRGISFRMDLVDLPRHEREHPDYPLPSGAIQAQDLEIVIVSLFGFSLIGAAVLGYPVFVRTPRGNALRSTFGRSTSTSSGGSHLAHVCRDALALAEAGD
jgi:hypothetical protein